MTNQLVAEVESLSPHILEACGDVFINDVHTIREMDTPERALGNCGFVAEKVIEATEDAVFLQGLKTTYTGIQTPSGNHFAVLVSKDGLPEEKSVILDFTARQFDKDAPFPLVMDCWEWQVWVEGKIGRVGNWYHSYRW